MANILHLETTTLNCGVAIFSSSEVIASKAFEKKDILTLRTSCLS